MQLVPLTTIINKKILEDITLNEVILLTSYILNGGVVWLTGDACNINTMGKHNRNEILLAIRVVTGSGANPSALFMRNLHRVPDIEPDIRDMLVSSIRRYS